jgi:hypothetical protein
MCCWRRTEEISWTVRFRNGDVLHRVKEQRNIVHTIKRRKADWICHILRRNCLVKHISERNVERLRRWGRRRKQLLDRLKEKIGCMKLKERSEFTFVHLCGCGWIVCLLNFLRFLSVCLKFDRWSYCKGVMRMRPARNVCHHCVLYFPWKPNSKLQRFLLWPDYTSSQWQFDSRNYSQYVLMGGGGGGVVVKALRFKPGGRGFDSRWYHWNFWVT